MPKKGKKKTAPKKKTVTVKIGAKNGSDTLSLIAGGIGGAIAGKILTNLATKMLPTMNAQTRNWIAIGVQVGGGYLLSTKVDAPMFKGVGYGLAIGGGLKLAGTVLPALGRAPVLIPARGGEALVGGFYDVPRLGAVTPNGEFPRPNTVGNVGKVDNMTAAYAAGALL
jgi:hypothetical protein